MILSSHYYCKDSNLSDNKYVIKNDDKRFFPAKAKQAFPIWYQYIRKNYPNEHIVLFDEPNSFVPIQESLKYVQEPVEFVNDYNYNPAVKFHIKNCSSLENVKNRSTKGYRQTAAVARSYLDALNFAYSTNNDFFYVDLDCFLNTNIFKFRDDADVLAQNISPFQFTTDAYCLFISAKKLHEMDWLYKLPEFLTDVFYNSEDIARIHTFFEGGLFKLFCHGNYKALSKINVTHSTCYKNLLEFLKKNPLDTKEYYGFIKLMEDIDLQQLINEGCKVDFDDATYYE